MKIILLPSLLFFGIACTPREQASYLTNDSDVIISADSTGISAKNFQFSADQLFPKKNWQCDWIWLNKRAHAAYQETYTTWINNSTSARQYRALFRKGFAVNALPSLAILSISADVSFRAYINGKFICQGPANIGSDYEDQTPPEHWFFTTHDVKKYLQAGENILAVEVYSFDLALSETTSGKGKFICDLDTGNNQTILSTDSTWRCQVDSCLSGTREGLVYDANYEFPDWQSNHFTDTDWPRASIVDAPKKG